MLTKTQLDALKVGDKVWSKGLLTGEPEPSVIMAMFATEAIRVFVLTIPFMDVEMMGTFSATPEDALKHESELAEFGG
jgi:hypothetical protein